METKREKKSTIKISLNISGNKKEGDNFGECETSENCDLRVKSKSKEASQALGLIEDIRNGTFNYKDLEEIYFMNDTDLEKMINDSRRVEEMQEKSVNYEKDENVENDVYDNLFKLTCRKGEEEGREIMPEEMNYSERSISNDNNQVNRANRNLFVMNNKVGKVCIIRFPPEVSKEIKKNLIKENLELEIEPTNLLNSRLFLIHFKNINKKYYGILLELSTHIEIHKTLDRHNLYKTNDVSQMIYVYDPNEKKKKKKKKCKKMLKNFIKNNFQLNCGISNKVHNFHFQNHAKLFKYHDIYFAENFIYEYLNAKYYDYYDMYVKTYAEMHNHLRIGQDTHKRQNEIVDETTDISEIINSLDNTYIIMKEMEDKTEGGISLETMLNYEIPREDYESDVSDLLIGGRHYLRKRS
ncbi:transcription initiation factor TFIID subunit 7 [Plasmodium gonderi]|uniref:Transcription initiation factor TFIID subunit 7 n=1 Tax=Plasmodium gonderi TaxID=77519 RepID=A0A1Y1JIS1_PLAGO|nr:transcription initiation factor TFIID subunit 7 [Plasmodium gonderi]GAW80353.1 transcription initiation factor TFIID subunit 7 [Plasmodium gonderi]